MAIAVVVTLALFLCDCVGSHQKCVEGSSPTRVYTRSNSYSLLGSISYPVCFEPVVQVLLERKASSVDVFQDYCQDVEVQPSRAIRSLNNASLVGNPLPVCDENYLTQNYFINGSIDVTIANVSITNSSSATIYVCFFTESSKYYNFLMAGEDWKKHISKTDCKTSGVENGGSYAFSFDISEPTFVFLAVASTAYLHLEQLNFSATGQNISSLGGNSIKVCELNGYHMNCSVGLQNYTAEKNQRVCLVAFEERNPDNSYDYSNLTVILPKVSEISIKDTKYFEIAFAVTLVTFLLLLSTVTFVHLYLWKCYKQKKGANERLTYTGPYPKVDSINCIFAQPKTTGLPSSQAPTVHVGSTDDWNTVVSTQASDSTRNGVIVVPHRTATASPGPSAAPINQVPVSDPVGNPIQETDHPDAPSQKLNGNVTLPVSEISGLPSFNVENGSEQRFGEGISETGEN